MMPARQQQGERIAEGLAWWGVAIVVISAALSPIDGGTGIMYGLALLAAAITVTWFRLVPDPFGNRAMSIAAVGIYIAIIAAANYFTGGIESPLFILYFAPLLAAFFLFRPGLQLVLGAAEHACFIAQFAVPVILFGEAADWETFLSRSLQLASLGFFAYFAARATGQRIKQAETEKEAIARREERLLFVAESGQELSSAKNRDDLVEQALRAAVSLFKADAAFLIRYLGGAPEGVSPLCIRTKKGFSITSEPLTDLLPVLTEPIGSSEPFRLADRWTGTTAQQTTTDGSSQLAETLTSDGGGPYTALLKPESMVLAPIENKNRTLGLLGLTAQPDRTFSDEELRLIKVFAGEVGVHLDRSIALEAAASRLDGGSGTLGITERIGLLSLEVGAAKSVKEAVGVISGSVPTLFGAGDGGIYVLHESHASLEAHSVVKSGCRFPEVARDCPAIREKAGVGSPCGTNPCRFLTRYRNLTACLPIISGEYLLGVFQVQAPDPVIGDPLPLMEEVVKAVAAPLAGVRSFEYYEPSGFYDRLTGAHSWPFIEHQVSYVHKMSAEAGRHYSLAVVGIDNMKRINDEFGRLAGDRALIAFVDVSRGELKSTDLLGRWRDDLFVLCFPHSDKDEAFATVERVRRAAEEVYAGPDHGHSGTISAGVATSFGGGTHRDVLETCLERLKKAKAAGGSRVESRS